MYDASHHKLTVTITKQGFNPASLTVNKGDTVTFINKSGRQAWPASDFHPTHLLYPDFDPKQPIEKDLSWGFTFGRAGTWTYHNHLFPSQRGVIVVLAPDGPTAGDQVPCKSEPDQPICWSESINNALENQGLEAAFKKVEELYTTEPRFSADCHGFVHKLGETAYRLYSQNKSFPLSPAASYCGYGFYHGFMEELFIRTSNMIQAGNFCDLVYKKQNIVSGDSCYHGLGHGAEAMAVSDPTLWGDAKKMFSKALLVCDKASGEDKLKFSRCASGVFMEVSDYYVSGTYKLTFDKTDPFAICRLQEERVKVDCYTQLYAVLTALSGRDLAKAAGFVEKIQEDHYAEESMQTLSASMMDIQAKDHKKDISVCRNVQDRLKLPCIKGLALAFLLGGAPGKGFVQASDFCQKSDLTTSEIKACFDSIFVQVSRESNDTQLIDYCRATPIGYKNEVCK